MPESLGWVVCLLQNKEMTGVELWGRELAWDAEIV